MGIGAVFPTEGREAAAVEVPGDTDAAPPSTRMLKGMASLSLPPDLISSSSSLPCRSMWRSSPSWNFPTSATSIVSRYPLVPATLLGRLAVDRRRRGKGFGETLLVDALRRSWRLSKQIGSVAVVVDAKDQQAKAFYEHFGFMSLPDQDRRLFLLMSTIRKLST